jgi:hypothetical protein
MSESRVNYRQEVGDHHQHSALILFIDAFSSKSIVSNHFHPSNFIQSICEKWLWSVILTKIFIL